MTLARVNSKPALAGLLACLLVCACALAWWALQPGVTLGEGEELDTFDPRERELARSLGAMQGVEWARVHIAAAEGDAPARASIVIKSDESEGLVASQVASMARLVAAGVEGLGAESVSITDASGRSLWPETSTAPDSEGWNPLGLRRAQEALVEAKAARVLERIVGRGRFEVQSTVEVQGGRVTRTRRSIDPESAVVTSESKTKDKAPSDGSIARSESEVAFEYDSLETHEEAPPGEIVRISLAVIVDAEGGADLDAAAMGDIERAVKSAVGFDESRGDRMTLSSRPFVTLAGQSDVAGPGFLQTLQPFAGPAALLLGVLVLAFLVLRLAREAFARPSGEDEEGAALEASSPKKVARLRARLSRVADEHPEVMAQAVRVWLHESRRGA